MATVKWEFRNNQMGDQVGAPISTQEDFNRRFCTRYTDILTCCFDSWKNSKI